MHARRIRPDTGHLDRRRLAAAGLSALLPGLGQALNGRRRLAALFLVPSLILLGAGLFLWSSQSPTRLAAWAVSPATLSALLTLNMALLLWRLVSVGQAFVDTRHAGPTGRLGVVGLVLLALFVVIPHVAVYRYGTAMADAFTLVFETKLRGAAAEPDAGPNLDERINLLLVGIDKTSGRSATLTDTMIVASLDTVGKSVSLVSIPRDLVNVPLGNGDVFGPKVNSLMSYANAHRDEFPAGGLGSLRRAIGALLGIEIPYYAQVNFRGFRRMVDAAGGVDVTVKEAIDDPGYGVDGYRIEPGRHHLDGEEALAYVRSRKGLGDSDFTRAGRQQQVLVALRDAVTRDGSLFWELPGLLEAVGGTVRTNMPVSRLPELAAIADELGDDAVVRVVIRHPLVKSKSTQYGSSLVPNVKAIRRVAADLFPEPGVPPVPWPTPEPTKGPGASPSS